MILQPKKEEEEDEEEKKEEEEDEEEKKEKEKEKEEEEEEEEIVSMVFHSGGKHSVELTNTSKVLRCTSSSRVEFIPYILSKALMTMQTSRRYRIKRATNDES